MNTWMLHAHINLDHMTSLLSGPVVDTLVGGYWSVKGDEDHLMTDTSMQKNQTGPCVAA